MNVKSPQEIAKMKEGGKILRETLQALKAATKPGTKAEAINRMAGDLLAKAQAEPAFLGHEGFPANLCISLNKELVHGIPGKKIIEAGDMVSYDLGVKYKGLFTDAAITFTIGEPDSEQAKIMEVCHQCLLIGIKAAKTGNRVGDIGAVIQEHAEKNGYSVVKKLVGHGVGHAVHEDPIVPNYGAPATGEELLEGACLAIEPMIYKGGQDVVLTKDNWTFIGMEQVANCHFEHTIVVRKGGGEIIT